MSRNLCMTACKFCDGTVRTHEAPRPITEREAGVYFPEFVGMLVAKAACVDCEAPYLAWVDMRTCKGPPHEGRRWAPHAASGESHCDLSHYHAFNDEPAEADMPKYAIETVRQRKPWPACYVCSKPMNNGHCIDWRCKP